MMNVPPTIDSPNEIEKKIPRQNERLGTLKKNHPPSFQPSTFMILKVQHIVTSRGRIPMNSTWNPKTNQFKMDGNGQTTISYIKI